LLYRAPEDAAAAPAMTAVPIEPEAPALELSGQPGARGAGEQRPEQPVPASRLSLDPPLVIPVSLVSVPVAERVGGENHADVPSDESEPDPSEVRRHIAAAQRNLDPDHQIRRAMDAFLSPTRSNGD
jgi:hypothetical protein